ncbi:MAG: FliI/YscN family ATPase [Planctomycetes bacterium]|nr:FliI/YscN family ATPase [Planctomycetota bacterium]
MLTMISIDKYQQILSSAPDQHLSGRITQVVGLAIYADGPLVPVGELCIIEGAQGSFPALVSGFRDGHIVLQPLDYADGLRSGDKVIATGHGLDVPVGPALIGRVINALGEPIDKLGPIVGQARRAAMANPPPALGRRHIDEVLETGIKVIDSLFTVGKGQRLGIFAGSGVGKSTLLGEMAKWCTADVNVIALVGERGREVGEFIDKVLGPEGLKRSVVIVATSDRPAIERVMAANAAHAIAEHFRDAGLDVLLMMDSLTRFCQAQRDLGLAAGEAPANRGFPPSTFALLPRLLERSGTGVTGSITGLYTVLVEGDDEQDPVADNARAVLDGHLFLSRAMAGRGQFPAIDPLLSISRLHIDLCAEDEQAISAEMRTLWGEYERVRDLVEVGAYRSGSNEIVDKAVALYPALSAFIAQGLGEHHTRLESFTELREICQQSVQVTPQVGVV